MNHGHCHDSLPDGAGREISDLASCESVRSPSCPEINGTFWTSSKASKNNLKSQLSPSPMGFWRILQAVGCCSSRCSVQASALSCQPWYNPALKVEEHRKNKWPATAPNTSRGSVESGHNSMHSQASYGSWPP